MAADDQPIEVTGEVKPLYDFEDRHEEFNTSPLAKEIQQGGLSVRNVGTPYGLRAYKNKDGSYGGEMMPKAEGWLGKLQNIGHPGSFSTELSVEDDQGSFPSIVPTLSPEQLNKLLSLKDSDPMPRDILDVAHDFAVKRRAQGLSPFKEIWEK